MQRVAIVGLPGSGKTTLAEKLGALTGLDVLHVDGMFRQADGGKMSDAECQAKMRAVFDRTHYIFEGSQGWSFKSRVAHSDTVIWMDLGFRDRLRNAMRRRRSRIRELRQMGRKPDSSAKFLAWFILRQLLDGRALPAVLADRPAHVRLVRLRSFAEAQTFLDGLPK